MQLTDEQLKDIENLGGLNYSPDKVAMMLAVDKDEFLSDFNMSDTDPRYIEGQIRFHYDRGLLMAQQKIDAANLKMAEEGNLTAIQQYKKDLRHREIQNAKMKTVYQESKTTLDAVQKAIESGDTSDIPPSFLSYAAQLEFIHVLFLKLNSKQSIIQAVRNKWPHLSFRLIASLYADSLSYFNTVNKVSVETWTEIYAERMDNLASLALAMDDIKGTKEAWEKAATMRGVGKADNNAIPKSLLVRKRQVHTTDITKIGLPQANRKLLSEFIEKMDLTIRQKDRFKREAGVKDNPFEIALPNEE